MPQAIAFAIEQVGVDVVGAGLWLSFVLVVTIAVVSGSHFYPEAR